jgi:polysaccharide biosynthesis transport protein
MNPLFNDTSLPVRPASPLPLPPLPPTSPNSAANGYPGAQTPGLNLGDIYYTLFRHKWRIILCTLVGIGGAAAVHRLTPAPFLSEAKLFVRYVVSENKNFGPGARDTNAKSPDQRGETIMKSEVEILGSTDLARQVVEGVGAERILAQLGGGNDPGAALGAVRTNLTIAVPPSSSVIHVAFRHPDPDVVQPVLREVIDRYLKLHVATHTANGMLGDFLTQETDQLRARLSQTEEELRRATLRAGIISLEDAKRDYSGQLASIRRDIFTAQADLAQRVAMLEELDRRFSGAANPSENEATVPADVVLEFQTVTQQVQLLQRMELDLLSQFTPENARVKEIRALLAAALQEHQALQERHPRLVQRQLVSQNGSEAGLLDPRAVGSQITALEARIKALTSQLEQVRADAAKLDEMEGTIVNLRRKKELEEENYRYYAASREQSRINETLGNGRVSNISQIQAPSPPSRDRGKTEKFVGLLLVGGLCLGVAWSFAIELYFDRSLKRPVDIERNLNVPLFLAIPKLRRKQLAATALMLKGAPGRKGHATANGVANGNGANGHAKGKSSGSTAIDPLQPFHDTLRDRLTGYFESIDLTHKPKLVAITGLRDRAGVSTTAAGLARSLSETGEGNVLLVDMNVSHGVAKQYMKGQPACELDDVLEARDNAHVDEKLFIVAERTSSDRLSRNLPQRFNKLVPRLKASDFDYIIFDMPPVSQISITPRLAGYMDMVLMVVESEKTDRDLVQRAANLLSGSRARVGVILNKTKRYVPQSLFQDNLMTS